MASSVELQQAIIQLHDIARVIEQEIGQGALSEDVRKCGDRLTTLIKEQE
jgi:hypothetical protein